MIESILAVGDFGKINPSIPARKMDMENLPPHKGVCWHKCNSDWVVKVCKHDHSVNPSKRRNFQKTFLDFDVAVRVRDYVARMLHGPGKKLNTDGRLPPGVSRIDVIQWLIRQDVIEPHELKRFTARVKELDKITPP